MKSLKELGYAKEGMTLIDNKGNKATITAVGDIGGATILHFDHSESFTMLDWDRLRTDVYVSDQIK